MKTILLMILGLTVLLPSLAGACMTNWGAYGGYGMMGHGFGTSILLVAGGLVWTLVGILAMVWLWQHINKK